MRRIFSPFFIMPILVFFAGIAPPAEAFQAPGSPKYKIHLELFCDGALQPMSAQQWGAELNNRTLGFHGVEIRGGRASEELDVVNTAGNLWTARGMLTKNDTLLMPGGKTFTRVQLRQLPAYLEEIVEAQIAKKEAEKVAAGNAGVFPPQRLPFGLKAAAYEEMFAELEQPTGFSTKNMARGEFLRRITASVKHKVVLDKELAAAIVADKEDVITEELQDVSRGTALAYGLRYVGLCLIPKMASEAADAKLVYHFVPTKEAPDEIFPVGHHLQEPERFSFPMILEQFNANVNGAGLDQVLAAVSGRLQAPILFDYNSMAREGIEIEEITVKYKPQQVSYNRLLDDTLAQAKLIKEVRVDEAGNVFIWVTTLKKVKE